MRLSLSLIALGLISTAALAAPKPVLPAQFRVKACTQKTASGLRYRVVNPGKGRLPKDDDTVVVNYLGFFPATREAFDSGKKSVFQVNGVVPGFSEGLKLMRPGARFTLCIPAALAYGAEGVPGAIPPDTDIAFDVTLIGIVPGR